MSKTPSPGMTSLAGTVLAHGAKHFRDWRPTDEEILSMAACIVSLDVEPGQEQPRKRKLKKAKDPGTAPTKKRGLGVVS